MTDARAGRVLVVDDQENFCWIVAKILAERGHAVRIVQSAQAALDACAVFPFQVALVDYRLPDMNGLVLIDQLRTRLRRFRAILMTSYGTAALEEAAAQARVFAFLSKPFVNEIMIQTVEGALHQRGTLSSLWGRRSPTLFPGRQGVSES